MEMVLQYCRGGMESEEFVESEHHNITVMFFFFFDLRVSRGKPAAPSAGLPHRRGGGASHFHQRVSSLGEEP